MKLEKDVYIKKVIKSAIFNNGFYPINKAKINLPESKLIGKYAIVLIIDRKQYHQMKYKFKDKKEGIKKSQELIEQIMDDPRKVLDSL